MRNIPIILIIAAAMLACTLVYEGVKWVLSPGQNRLREDVRRSWNLEPASEQKGDDPEDDAADHKPVKP
jgi:hypothetical protein